jgi:D-arabinose 1-dehydrogenase-like Zn-dependent alcohol dehydrogenase
VSGTAGASASKSAGTMTSWRVAAFGEPLVRMTDAVPTPQGTEVVLRVIAAGVCHSDLHIADGYFDLGGEKRMEMAVRLPRTLGHEIAGEVVAAGPDADVAPGARRVVFPWIGCGACALCAAGDEHLCARPQTLGFARDGGFSDHVVVPHPRYLLEYGDLPAELAATYACAGLTAFSALHKAEPVSDEHPLLIVGAGGVGESAIRFARAVYGVHPAVADIDERKRENALASGAAIAFDPRDADARKAAREHAGGGFAAAIDFVGRPETAELAMSLVRKGGKVIVVGLYGGTLALALPMLPLRAITIAGSYVGSLRQLESLLAMARAGTPPNVHIESRPLDEAQQALDALRAGTVVGRTVLVPAP